MAYQCNCITDNRHFSAVRAPGLPRAVINRFVMCYKLSKAAGKQVQWSPTHLQSMTACLSIINEESQGPFFDSLSAMIAQLWAFGEQTN